MKAVVSATGPEVITREYLQDLQLNAQARAAAEGAAEHKQLCKDVKKEVDEFVQRCLKDAGSGGGSHETNHVMFFRNKTDLTSTVRLRDMVYEALTKRLSGVELSVTLCGELPHHVFVDACWR